MANCSWMVTLKEGTKKTGVVQVHADELEFAEGGLVFWHYKDGKRHYASFSVAYGCWRTATIISQLTGYRNSIEILDPAKDKDLPL